MITSGTAGQNFNSLTNGATMTDYDDYWNTHNRDFCINLPQTGICSRMDLFRRDLIGKRVLHVGCTDWPFTKEKLLCGELLHQILAGICSELHGMDIEKDAIEMMQQSGIPNLNIVSIYNLSEAPPFIEKKFDAVVVSEVIEHLANPGLALGAIRDFILKTNSQCEVIFTIPNYQNFFINILVGLRSKECVHYDHKYYFSYRTFRALLEACSFEVIDFSFILYTEGSQKFGGIKLKTVSRLLPALAPHLYFRCTVKL
jgi:2-polyprenyl-3-methyl-5-hydroxy-6-metoxy-1,4-benzoquinol methylase